MNSWHLVVSDVRISIKPSVSKRRSPYLGLEFLILSLLDLLASYAGKQCRRLLSCSPTKLRSKSTPRPVTLDIANTGVILFDATEIRSTLVIHSLVLKLKHGWV